MCHQPVPADVRVGVNPRPQVLQRPLPRQFIQRNGLVQYIGPLSGRHIRVQPGQRALIDLRVLLTAPAQHALGVIPVLDIVILVALIEPINFAFDDIVNTNCAIN